MLAAAALDGGNPKIKEDLQGAIRDAVKLTDRAVTVLAKKIGTAAGLSSKSLTYANGDRYEGHILQTSDASQPSALRNIRHGHGVYHYASSKSRFEGEFLNDERHGSGTLFAEGGDVYQGQWCADQQHGNGVTTHWSPQGGVWVYAGDFRDGSRSGYGALLVRDRGFLAGLWSAGDLVRGVELSTTGPDGVEAAVIGLSSNADTTREKVCDDEHGEENVEEENLKVDERGRVVLGSTPAFWSSGELTLWLRGLGIDAATLGSAGWPRSFDELMERCQDAVSGEAAAAARHSWRRTVGLANGALRGVAEDLALPMRSWEELQVALPSLGRRLIPRAEISEAAGDKTTNWRDMPVELVPLPIRMRTSLAAVASGSGSANACASGGASASSGDAGASAAVAPSSTADEAAAPASSTSASSFMPLWAARGFAQDLEVLAATRHPHIRQLLGVTLANDEESGGVDVIPTLVYEGIRGGNFLFEWIHASLPDGSRRSMDFRLEMRVCLGVCEGLAALQARGIVFGALCSVNVELQKVGSGEIVVRLAHVGASWWRWGWRRCLRDRDPGGPRRRALIVEEFVKRFAVCPINWLAPEVLRGGTPTEAADVYGVGLLLWEMLYRTIPYGDYSIAQIIGAVGYGTRCLQCPASPLASTETSFLHEVVQRCARRDPTTRPRVSTLLTSLQEAAKTYEKRRAQRSAFEKLSDKTEAFATGLFSGKLTLGKSAARSAAPPSTPVAAAAQATDGPRMIRLENGEWRRVDADLIEQYPGDEEKWRTLMAFRGRMGDDD
eukprot:TRINITY_DN40818_c0_g1_i1.p1 TRINITY_DN40818_c0_g1~~TRINITY_DN40818_c0_g1_i1.p1  ORF type:complete len:817 (+),score=138.91 TRINITY_DN40818_c0_g1_i1:103-2451(+)